MPWWDGSLSSSPRPNFKLSASHRRANNQSTLSIPFSTCSPGPTRVLYCCPVYICKISCPPFASQSVTPRTCTLLTLPFRVLCATRIFITRQGAPLLCDLGSWASNDAFLVDGRTCCDSNHYCWWSLTSSFIGGSQAPQSLWFSAGFTCSLQQAKANSMLLVPERQTDLCRSVM